MKQFFTSWSFLLGAAILTPLSVGAYVICGPTPPPTPPVVPPTVTVVPPVPPTTPPTTPSTPPPSTSAVVPSSGGFSSSGSSGCVPMINGAYTACYYNTHPQPNVSTGGAPMPIEEVRKINKKLKD